MKLSIVSCVCWPFLYVLWKYVYSECSPIFKHWFLCWSLSCKSSLYVLDASFLSAIWFPYISACWLFTFVMVLSQKFLILMKSNFSMFSCRLCFDVVSKKALPSLRSWRFTPIFSLSLKIFFLFYYLPILYLQIASLLMVHKMLSVAHLSFVHTEVSCFLCLIAAAATDLFSFRIKMGAFIYNLIFNSFSGKSFLDS